MEKNGYSIKGVKKSFGDLCVLDNFTIEVEESKIICILGPSGCGKTTMLNLVSNIISPDEGEIIGFEDRSISYLFQETRLLKWRTVKENMEFILKDVYKKDTNKVIDKYLNIVDLIDYKSYYPDELSGGMQQRLAIARAFAYPSEVLLMDEPFKSLDLEIKLNIIKYFLELWKTDKKSVFFVTHDIHAALLLGDYIYVLSQKPTKVKEIIVNEIPHEERALKNSELLKIEKKLYEAFSS